MFEHHQQFHAGCLRSASVPSGPGGVIVALAKAIRVECPAVGPHEPAHILLQQGTILYAIAGLSDVKSDIDKHLAGSVGLSELRLGASGLLGIEPTIRDTIALSDDGEKLIDDWLDEHAIFIVMTLPEDEIVLAHVAPVGLFNGIRRAWNGETTNEGGRSDSKHT